MKTKHFLSILFATLLSGAAFAQNANESIPRNQNYTGVLSMNNVTSFYGHHIPSAITSAMKNMRIFETSTSDLLVYPNPNYGLAHVVLHEPAPSWVYVIVIDMNGSLLKAMQFPPSSYDLQVDMGGLPAGLYSVRVFGDLVSYHNLRVFKQT